MSSVVLPEAPGSRGAEHELPSAPGCPARPDRPRGEGRLCILPSRGRAPSGDERTARATGLFDASSKAGLSTEVATTENRRRIRRLSPATTAAG